MRNDLWATALDVNCFPERARGNQNLQLISEKVTTPSHRIGQYPHHLLNTWIQLCLTQKTAHPIIEDGPVPKLLPKLLFVRSGQHRKRTWSALRDLHHANMSWKMRNIMIFHKEGVQATSMRRAASKHTTLLLLAATCAPLLGWKWYGS